MTGTLLPHPLTGRRYASPVPPGEGWPGDPAVASTPVAEQAPDVVRLASSATALSGADGLDARVSVCRACPRLVSWREEVAVIKRRAFADEPYWGRPIAGWGDERPWLLVIGLAPAAHGGNRTGRVFTGDRSGDWIFAALHRAGLAAQATSVTAGDGQALVGARIVAPVRCAPPDNKPLPAERATCAPWMDREVSLLDAAGRLRAVLALGGFAWEASLACAGRLAWELPTPRPRFGHGAEAVLRTPSGQDVLLIGCYHVSQQNTFTGRLTAQMLDSVLARAQEVATQRPRPTW